MTEEKKEENDVLTVLVRLILFAATVILMPVALIGDCMSQAPSGFTPTGHPGMPLPGTPTDSSGRPMPKGKTMREYLIAEIGIKNPNHPKAKEGLDKLEAEAQRFYDKDLKEAQNPEKFYLIKGSGKYVSLKAKKLLDKKLQELGRQLDDEYLIPILKVDNVSIFIDDRKFHEEVWMSRTPGELMMEANREYHEQTGDQFVFGAGARSPERQAISQALWYTHCEGKWTTKLLKIFGYKCEKSMGSEVGSCFGTAHHPGFAVDLQYGKMKNPALAREILRKKGFLVDCSKDRPHVDWSKDRCW